MAGARAQAMRISGCVFRGLSHPALAVRDAQQTDKADARGIGHILRAGWFQKIYVKNEEIYRLVLVVHAVAQPQRQDPRHRKRDPPFDQDVWARGQQGQPEPVRRGWANRWPAFR